MGHPNRRAVENEGGRGAWGRPELGHQLFKNAVACFLHDGQRQLLPRLIITAGVAGRLYALFTPIPHPFTGVRPKAGRQTPQQIDDGSFQRRSAVESLGYQEPQHDQGRENSVVSLDTSFGLGLEEEIGG